MKNELKNLFTNLVRSSEFSKLRNWQERFTEIWSTENIVDGKSSIEDHDLIGIKAPTGTGKTLLGILILEYFRRKNFSCMYASGDYGLLDKVSDHANKLSIPTVVLKGKGATKNSKKHLRRIDHNKYYNKKEAIGLTVYANLLYSSDILKPDILLVDDADAFLDAIMNRFKIRIPKDKYPDLWERIFSLLDKDIYGDVELIKTVGQVGGIMAELLYFTEAFKAYDILDEFFNQEFGGKKSFEIKNDLQEIYWSWKNNSDIWKSFFIYISTNEIELHPYVPPTDSILDFDKVKKLILMSATLGDSGVLNWELGTQYEKRIVIDETWFEPRDIAMGARLVFPIADLDEKKHVEFINMLIKEFKKVIVLSRSHNEAHHLLENLKSDKMLLYSNAADIESFSKISSGVLIVAGRYFGLDFKEESAKIGVITKIPKYLNNVDYIQGRKFENSFLYNKKISRRIVQALGRCNRSENDIAAYFVLDNELYEDFTGEKKYFNNFPILLLAETNLGLNYTKTLESKECFNVTKQFLQGGYTSYFKNRKEQLNVEKARVKEYNSSNYLGLFEEAHAWNLLARENYSRARDVFKRVAEALIENQIEETRNRIPLNYYLAAFSSYMLYQRGGSSSSDDECKELLLLAKDEADLTWFNRLEFLPIMPKERKVSVEEGDITIKTLEGMSKDPETFLNQIWDTEEFKPFQSKITEIFRLLVKDEPSGFEKSINIFFEQFIKSLLEINGIEYDEKKDTLYNLIYLLKEEKLISKETFNKGTNYEDNVLLSRNLNIHRGAESKTLVDALEKLIEWREFLTDLIRDIHVLRVISDLSDEVIEQIKVSSSFRRQPSKFRITDKIVNSYIETSSAIKFEIGWSQISATNIESLNIVLLGKEKLKIKVI